MKHFFRYAGLSACIIIIASLNSHAQQKLQLKIGYSVNTPIGSSFKNFISNTSFRGANGELVYSVNDQLSLGLGVSYNDFYQKYPRQLIDTKYGEISAVVSNSIQVTPVVAKVNYSFVKGGSMQPYAGLGAGFNVINYNQYRGEFPESKTTLKPALQADAGINIPLNKVRGIGLNIGANFNYMPFNYNEIKTLNNWGIHAGFFFPLR